MFKNLTLPTPAWAKKLLAFIIFLMMLVQPALSSMPVNEHTKAWLVWLIPILLGAIGWWAQSQVDEQKKKILQANGM